MGRGQVPNTWCQLAATHLAPKRKMRLRLSVLTLWELLNSWRQLTFSLRARPSWLERPRAAQGIAARMMAQRRPMER